jgi:hypothetical protein
LRCHGHQAGLDPSPSVETTAALRWHELDRRLVFEMCDYAERRFGARWRRSERDFVDPERALELAIPWSVYGSTSKASPSYGGSCANRIARWLPMNASGWPPRSRHGSGSGR